MGARAIEAIHLGARVLAKHVDGGGGGGRSRGAACGSASCARIVLCPHHLVCTALLLDFRFLQVILHVSRLGGIQHRIVLLGSGRRAQVGRRVEDGLSPMGEHPIQLLHRELRQIAALVLCPGPFLLE